MNAISPNPSTEINGLGSNKRQRTEDSEEERHPEAEGGDGLQQPEGPGAETIQNGEVSSEARAARPALRPENPTAEERATHYLTHCPYRSWCRACVLGRGRDRHHRRIDGSGDLVPRIALDYMFFADYGITKTLEEAKELIEKHGGNVREIQPVLVMKDYARDSI